MKNVLSSLGRKKKGDMKKPVGEFKLELEEWKARESMLIIVAMWW